MVEKKELDLPAAGHHAHENSKAERKKCNRSFSHTYKFNIKRLMKATLIFELQFLGTILGR